MGDAETVMPNKTSTAWLRVRLMDTVRLTGIFRFQQDRSEVIYEDDASDISKY